MFRRGINIVRITVGVMNHFLLIIVEVALVGYASPPIFCRRKKRGDCTGGAALGGGGCPWWCLLLNQN